MAAVSDEIQFRLLPVEKIYSIKPNFIGPTVVPATSSLPPTPPASLPLPPNPGVASGDAGFTAATVSAAPRPQPSVPMYNLAPGQAASVVLPPLHYQGLTVAQPFSYRQARTLHDWPLSVVHHLPLQVR